MWGWLRLETALASRARLAQPGAGREMGGQDLDGHLAAEPAVPSAVDLAHAPGSQRSQDLVRAETGSGVEGHRDEPRAS